MVLLLCYYFPVLVLSGTDFSFRPPPERRMLGLPLGRMNQGAPLRSALKVCSAFESSPWPAETVFFFLPPPCFNRGLSPTFRFKLALYKPSLNDRFPSFSPPRFGDTQLGRTWLSSLMMKLLKLSGSHLAVEDLPLSPRRQSGRKWQTHLFLVVPQFLSPSGTAFPSPKYVSSSLPDLRQREPLS